MLQEDSPFLKFACHNYAECEYLEREVTDNRAIDVYWQQGAGLNLDVCGYLMQNLMMMGFRPIGYLIYGKIKSDLYLSDRIGFNNNNNVHDFSNLMLLLSSSFLCLTGANLVPLRFYGSIIGRLSPPISLSACISKREQPLQKRR
jgi:hypothetical protein